MVTKKLLLLIGVVMIVWQGGCAAYDREVAKDESLALLPTKEIRPIWNVSYNLRKYLNTIKTPIRLGIKVTSMSGRVMFEQNDDQRFTPYGNVKLITAAAALHHLGPDYVFHTRILTNGQMQGDTLSGNVYLKAVGDPTITGTDIINFIGAIAAQGIKTIDGDFLCDYYDYDEQPYVEGVSLSDAIEYWNSPLFAMIDDCNYIDRSAPGKNIINLILTCDPTSLLVQKIEVTSLIEVFSEYVSMLCAYFGITVNGVYGVGHLPDNATTVLVEHTSEPLTTILAAMLRNGENIYADSLFKRMGADLYGTPGTWQSGSRAVSEFLETKVGIPGDEFNIEDGSGVSVNNRMSPSNMVKFLSWMYKSPLSNHFLNALPTIGLDGTIRGRVEKKAKRNILRAEEIHAPATLSGFVYGNGKPSAIFSMMIDGLIPPKDPFNISDEERAITEALATCLVK